MKRLIVALVAAVAVSTAFAKIVDTQGFETDRSAFVSDGEEGEDESFLDTYGTRPSFAAPYNFTDLGETAALQYGDKFLSLDTGDATLWRTNADEAAYFDMAMQFNPCASAPEIDEDTKIAIYLNSTSNLVVLAGDGSGGTVTNETGVQLAPGTWGRLTIAAVADGFKVTLNTNTDVGTFTSRKSDTTIKQVGFKGTGALDDFVARTTDPFIVDPVAKIGGEGYASLSAAMGDATNGVTVVLQKESNENVVLPEAGVVFNTNGQTYGGTVSAASGFGWTVDNGVYTADNNSASIWAGDVAGASWTDASNWSNHAVPTASTAVTIPATAVEGGWLIYLGNNAQAASINLLGDATFQREANFSQPGNIVLQSGITTDLEHPATLTLNTAAIFGPGGKTITIGCDIVSKSTLSTGWYSGFRTSGSGSATFEMNGDIEIQDVFYPVANINFNGAVVLNNGTFDRTGGTVDLSGTGVSGTPAFKGAVTLTGTSAIKTYAVTYNGAVSLGADSIISIGSSSQTYGENFSLSGSGRVIFDTQAPGAAMKAQFQKTDGTWTGVCELKGITFTGNPINPADYANSDSSLCFNGVTVPSFGASYSTEYVYPFDVEIVGSGLTLNGDFTRYNKFSGSLSGSGCLVASQGSPVLYFTGDKSRFTGSITNNAGAIIFGSSLVGSGTRIVVCGGESITNVASSTWKTSNLILQGALVVDGTIDVPDGCIWGNTGTGVIRFNDEATAFTTNKFQSGWNGTYVVGWEPTGAFNPNEYGYADSTVALAADLAESAYFGSGNKEAFAINPTIRLDANVSIKNGYGRESSYGTRNYPVTFAKLTSSGNYSLTLNAGSSKYYARDYNITVLDNFGGSLVLPAYSTLEIGTVNVASGTSLSGCIVPAMVDANASLCVAGYPVLTVAGTDSGHLVYSGTKATSGLYVATVQSGDDYYLSIADALTADKTTVTLLADNAEDVVLPAGGSIVTRGYTYSGEATTTSGYRVDYDDTTGTYTSTAINYVAKIEGGESYETLAEAVAAATDGAVVTLLGNLELDARVEPNKTMTFNLGGYTLSRTGTSGNGSVIDVKSGNVVITNGVIECTQDDAAIVADGVYALTVRAGATLTLDDLTVTVDSQAGACVYPFAGAAVTILGGTYGNNTADAYQYHANWTGMAVNQANVATQLITIYGGSFYKVDPSLGDDSWADGEGTFLAVGKATTLEGSYYVVGTATYTVRFFSDAEKQEQDQIGDTQSVVSGEKATAPAAPTKVGYTFTGWDPDTNAVIEAATDFVAQWSADSYTVTYNLDLSGATNAVGNIASYTIETAEFTLLPAGCEGYTFNGWTNALGNAVEKIAGGTTGDVTVYASWTKDEPVAPTIDPSADKVSVDVTAATAEAAIQALVVNPPAGSTATPGDYKELFDYTTVDNHDGTFTVTVDKIKDRVEQDVVEDAAAIVSGTAASGNVVVPAGLYYKVTTMTSLDGTGTTSIVSEGLSTGGNISVTKPGTTQGFIKVEMATKAID